MDERRFHHAIERDAAQRDHANLRLLIDTGLQLNAERELPTMTQLALNAGLALSGAAFGVFFYEEIGPDGDLSLKRRLAGPSAEAFADFVSKRPGPLLPPSLHGHGVFRSEDLLVDPRTAPDADSRPGLSPLAPLRPAADDIPVRSFLSVPVKSRTGMVLGVLRYGHPQRAVFPAQTEDLVSTVACQAAVAIENFRLTENLSREIALADQARAVLRATERQLHLALDAAQLGVWTWNSESGLITFDERAAALFGVRPDTPYLRRDLWRALLQPEDRQHSPEDLRRVLQSRGDYTAEYRIRLSDGQERWICANGTPQQDEQTHRVIGMTGTVQDVSSRKLQEASLRQSEKLAATGRLAATIAHEINNPLEAITNLIYLAKMETGTPHSVQQMLELADSELARVSQIAQQTLGFYRDTSRPIQIDINDLLRAVVDLFERKLTRKNLRCEMDLEPGLAVTGLQGEIRQVISNLLVNAIDASEHGAGNILIRGRHRERNGLGGVSILICDKGSGIPEHVRPRLFTPFMTTKQSLGTGLGLWVTRGMVEKHGGSVCFRSRTVQPAGTVFRVHLPRLAGPQVFAQTPELLH